MNTITPHLWFDKEAKEASEFYVKTFPDSKILNVNTLHDTPSGDVDVVNFEIFGKQFSAISAGPLFKFNPSISFFIGCETAEEADKYWNILVQGGQVLMPLDKYFFSDRYGWVQDKYGLSWQIILTKPESEPRPRIVPSLMFTGNVFGKCEEAINFYLSVFKPSQLGTIAKYGKNEQNEEENAVMYADFKLLDTWMAAMESSYEHKFDFNEAISLMVNCKDQAEIDYYWEKLSAVPESEQCGWLKDKFGVSWQVVPEAMDEMMNNGTPEQIGRVTEAFLKMKKFDLATLEKAYNGN